MTEYMDKQKAADLLDNLIGMVEDTQENDYDAALKMGIEALKAEAKPHQLTEVDLTELRHRFGKNVECVVRDMISGKEERWQNGMD